MPALPIEALSAAFVVGGLGIGFRWLFRQYTEFRNDGKPRRYNVDPWDRVLMERDSRLTGNVNKQMCEPEAPEYFKTNSALELSRPASL